MLRCAQSDSRRKAFFVRVSILCCAQYVMSVSQRSAQCGTPCLCDTVFLFSYCLLSSSCGKRHARHFCLHRKNLRLIRYGKRHIVRSKQFRSNKRNNCKQSCNQYENEQDVRRYYYARHYTRPRQYVFK